MLFSLLTIFYLIKQNTYCLIVFSLLVRIEGNTVAD